MKKTLNVSIIILIFIHSNLFIASAKVNETLNLSEEEKFTNKLSEIIYRDCQQKNITIKEKTLVNLRTKEALYFNIEKLEFFLNENSYHDLKTVLYPLVTRSFDRSFAKYIRGPEGPIFEIEQPYIKVKIGDQMYRVDYNGYNVLRCDGHQLDINDENFFWDNTKIERNDKYEVSLAPGSKATFGDKSDIVEINGDRNILNKSEGDDNNIIAENNSKKFLVDLFLSKGTLGGLMLGGLITLCYKLIYLKFKRKITKKK